MESDTMALPEDFVEFYTTFHEDSLFQIHHILFPLDGVPINASSYTDEALKNFKWQKSEWDFHKINPALNENYHIHFQMMGPKIVVETVTHNSNIFRMERRFAKSDGTWNLIYYVGMNPIKSLRK